MCTDTVSTGSSSYSWNFSGLDLLYTGQAVPQTSTATFNASSAQAGGSVTVTGGTNWWGNAGGAPVVGTGHTQSGSYYTIPSPGVFIGTTRATAVAATSSTVAISATKYACGQASSSVPPNPCTFTPGAPSGSFVVPASLAPGSYNVYIDETNTGPFMGNGPNDSFQTARGTSRGTAESVTPLVVGIPAAITSANSTTFTENAAGTFTVTATGSPTATLAETGSLPSGVTFVDNGDGTATLAGTPASGTAGSYPITVTATNGVGGPATQSFTLTVDAPAAITSGASTTFTEGQAGTFTVTSTGSPTTAIGESGILPTGVSFVDNGNGTATLAGTPASGTAGSYPITITATNGVGSPATQSFTLTVNAGAAITSGNATTFTENVAGTFTVTSTGSPTATLAETGALPSGVTFVDNGDGTATLAGTPASGTAGSYPITVTATNGVGSPATQSFTLTVDAPAAITSGNATTFTENSAGTFTVTTTGNPSAAISETGTLPSGLSFVDNGNGTATLAGPPASGTAGSYPITITATNGVGSPATQSFTLTVNAGAAITSGNATTFTENVAGTFTVTSTGSPTATLAETGALPSGVTFVDNGDGTATLAGTPASGTAGSYPITVTATNGVGSPATQSFTLTVDAPAAITSGNATTFTENSAGTFTVTTTGNPAAAISETGSLPSGVTLVDNGDGSATLSGIPLVGTAGSYPITITADNGVGSPATQSFTLTVSAEPLAPTITSGNATTFTENSAGTFTVTTTGNPAAAVSETGSLPSGVTFVDNGDGTATLAGTPASGTAGTYPITVTATNGVGSPAMQSFTLTVDAPAAITSGNATTFTENVVGTFTVTSTGSPTATLAETGALPGGVTFVDNGDGTATLAGTPASGTAGSYPITVTATNGVGSPATQSFTLTVDAPAAITSGNATTFTENSAGTFTVTTTGNPAAAISETGSLPSGVTLVDNGDGTATLAGTPASGTRGSYPVTITADNGVGSPATQSFTLTVNAPAAITSGNATTFTENVAGTFTVTSTGSPTAALSETGALPGGVTFVDNGDGTATLAGTPASGTAGSYPITVTATNGVGRPATQSFTLTVDAPAAITSGNATTFTENSAGTFTVTTTGNPSAAISETGSLPSGVTLHDNGDGTATLAGTPASGTRGSYPITVTADNGVGSPATQSFTLTVNAPAAITSGNATTFTENVAGTFTVTSTGSPTAALSETGALPGGVTFVDNGDGTATLAGTPASGTAGTYPITVTATNGVGSPATQSFTLSVSGATHAPTITSSNSTSFPAGANSTFTVTTTGSPTPALSATGALPSGVTFVDNGNGTATLAGTAATAGSYPITITATNGVGSPATQSFTLTVNSTTGPGVNYTGKISCSVNGKVKFSPRLTASSHSSITFQFKVKRCSGQNGTSLTQGTPSATLTGGSALFVLPPAQGYNCPLVESDLATPPALQFNLNWKAKRHATVAPSSVSVPTGSLVTGDTSVSLVYSGGSVLGGSFYNGGRGVVGLQLNIPVTVVNTFITTCGGHGSTGLKVPSGTLTIGS